MQLANFVQKPRKIDFFGVKVETHPRIDQARGIEEIFNQMREAQHRGTNLTGALIDLMRRQPVLQLPQPLRVPVNDTQWRTELMRGHGDEIALQQREPLLLRELLLERRCLLHEPALAAHQLDGIISEYDGGARHLPDLVAPFG